MGERFGESPYDGCLQEQRDRHIAEMTAQKVLEAQESKGRYYYSVRQTNPQPPPTHKDVLLKTWAQDTEAMAEPMLRQGMFGVWFPTDVNGAHMHPFFDEKADALAAQIAYLNSAAEVGK